MTSTSYPNYKPIQLAALTEWRSAEVRTNLRAWIPRLAPAYLPWQRWFASKGRAIAQAMLLDAMQLEFNASEAVWVCLIEVELERGGKETYLLPLVLSRSAERSAEERVIANLGPSSAGEQLRLLDGVAEASFRSRWLQLLLSDTTLTGKYGQLRFHTGSGAADRLPVVAHSRVGSAEQSNSSLQYFSAPGNPPAMLAKCFRKLMPGLNPDVEVTGFLSQAGFRNVPWLAAWAEYATPLERYTLSVLQPFVPNDGDGWEYMLRRLAVISSIPDLDEEIASLAQRTAEMHALLATGDEADFVPQPVSPRDIQEWSHSVPLQARQFADELRNSGLPSGISAIAQRVAPLLERLESLPEWLRGLQSGTRKIRIHGDYHLGQVLRVPGDFVIVDFEGEPARPLEFRRRKHSVLKDVAGMLRSFDYAANAALLALPEEQRAGRAGLLLGWRDHASAFYWNEYQRALAGANRNHVPLLPQSPGECARALDFFVLEKAVYELGYELHNRPGWLSIPLQGLLRLLG